MSLSDYLKKPGVQLLLAFVAGVLVTAAAMLIILSGRDDWQGVLTCENSDVGIPVSSSGGTILTWEDIKDCGVFMDYSMSDPVFTTDTSPDCYDYSVYRFQLTDGNRSVDGFQMGSTLQVLRGRTVVKEFDISASVVGLLKTGSEICVYQ